MAASATHQGSPSSQTWRETLPVYLAGAAAATPTVSIAAYQILLGAALLVLLIARFTNRSGPKLRWPPVTLPLFGFLSWTLISLAVSPDPHGGLPQIKKFYVFTMLFVVFAALRTLRQVRMVALGWIVGATLSALWALRQGWQMYLTTPKFLYYVYSNQGRITGFMDHWMTFSGITMMALLILGAFFLFAGRAQRQTRFLMPVLLIAFAILCLALLAGYQRTMWAGAAVGATWLLGAKNKWLTLLVPATIALLLAVNPLGVRDRAMAVIQPQQGVLDSAGHRAALRATGREMIKGHPWFGVGPEQIQKQFLNFAPPSVPRPLPVEWFVGHLHNVYYQYAAERGLPALAFLLWFLGQALWDFIIALRRLPLGGVDSAEARWMLQAAIAVIIAVMVAGYWELNLNDSEVLGLFLAVVACGYIARDVAVQQAP